MGGEGSDELSPAEAQRTRRNHFAGRARTFWNCPQYSANGLGAAEGRETGIRHYAERLSGAAARVVEVCTSLLLRLVVRPSWSRCFQPKGKGFGGSPYEDHEVPSLSKLRGAAAAGFLCPLYFDGGSQRQFFLGESFD